MGEEKEDNKQDKSKGDTSVNKNFFAIDMEDYEQQKIKDDDHDQNKVEFSEGNISNVFNLEEEQYQYKNKKEKQKKQADEYEEVN